MGPTGMPVNGETFVMPSNKAERLTRDMAIASGRARSDGGRLAASALTNPKRYLLHGTVLSYILYAVALLLYPSVAMSQGIRLDATTVQEVSTTVIPGTTNVLVVPAAAIVKFCNFPANAVPCSNVATTFTSSTLGTPCSTSTQITLVGSTTCVASPDANGNFGFWAVAGNYAYTVTLPGGINLGPYNVTLGIPSGTNLPVITTGTFNGIFVVDGINFANIAAAVTAAGTTNPRIILIPSTYAGTECPAVQNNLVFWDFRAGGRTGSGTSSFICTQNTVQYNTKTPGFTDSMIRMELTRTAVDATGSILPFYPIAHLLNATVTNGVVEGAGPECDIDGTLSGTLGFCIGFEATAFLTSTGGTVTNVVGGLGQAQTTVGSTTATTNAIGLWGRGAVSPYPTAPTNAYGVMCDAQTFGSARNYCFYAKGISLAGFSSSVGGWDFEDASNVAHRGVYVAADNSMNVQAVNAIGLNLADSGASTRLNVSSSGVKITAVNNGQGIQAFNSATTCTTGAAVGGTCTTAAITLPVGYSDTNYRLVCSGLTPTNVPIVQTVTKSNTTFTITIAALTAAAATFTSYDCTAVHN